MLRKIVKSTFKILNTLLYRVEYIHSEKFPDHGPAIIVSNHQHTFDVAFIHCKMHPWVYWVSKKELTDKPFIGNLIRKMGVMPVDRSTKDMSVVKKIYENIKKNRVIGIFPQATRIKNKEMIGSVIPKTGAIRIALKTGVPIIPVGIKGDYKLFRKMQVIIGDPIQLNDLEKKFEGHEDPVFKMTETIMETVYALTGYEYKLKITRGGNPGNEI
jgi:1-acyl-sn-glycerol-3-phosphate acyltransferase